MSITFVHHSVSMKLLLIVLEWLIVSNIWILYCEILVSNQDKVRVCLNGVFHAKVVRTWKGSGSVLRRVMWMVWVMMRRHATHWARRVQGRHWVERGNHSGGQEGRRWKRRGRRRRARQVDSLEDCLTHLLHFGHQLLLQKSEADLQMWGQSKNIFGKSVLTHQAKSLLDHI